MFTPNFVKQTDRRYSGLSYRGMTMGAGGCGVMTVYNIVSALRPEMKLTPKKVWEYMTSKGYVIPGQGTTWAGITATLKHYGISFVVTYSDSDVKKSLEAGNWILALAGPSRWTSSGHYFCIYDLRSNGKLSISDPYSSSDYCQKDGTLSEYLRANKCNWISIDPTKYPGYKKYKAKHTKVSIMYVDTAAANIRKGRGLKYGVKAVVKRGTKLKLGNELNGWYKIQSGTYKGYFIAESVLTAFEPYKHQYKALFKMNVRKGAGASTAVKGTLKKGTKITSSKRSGDWLYFPAVGGWVRRVSSDKSTTYLKRID